ncbi:protein WHAT'S THIS FACTOR 1, partial [Tanacetum coccineum]
FYKSSESSIPRETSLRDDVVVRGSDEPYSEPDIDPDIQAEIDEFIAYADALRAEWIDARVVVETTAREEVEMSVRGMVEVIESIQRDQGHKIIATGQQSVVQSERISELEWDNMRLRGILDVASQRVTFCQSFYNINGGENGDDYEGGNRGVNGNGNDNGNGGGNDNGNGNGNGAAERYPQFFEGCRAEVWGGRFLEFGVWEGNGELIRELVGTAYVSQYEDVPYEDVSNLDQASLEMEKRTVGVFHELLSLSLYKRIPVPILGKFCEEYRFSNAFSSVFTRHSGIFYMSLKGGIKTAMLREAYCGDELIDRDPLLKINDNLNELMAEGYNQREEQLKLQKQAVKC